MSFVICFFVSVTHQFSYAMRHNDALGGEAITNVVSKFRKIKEFHSSCNVASSLMYYIIIDGSIILYLQN